MSLQATLYPQTMKNLPSKPYVILIMTVIALQLGTTIVVKALRSLIPLDTPPADRCAQMRMSAQILMSGVQTALVLMRLEI